jgi:hypothetical protein
MPRITFRLAVALLTFMLGLTGVWLANLGSQLSDAILEQLMPTPTLDAPPTSEQFTDDDDAYAVYSKVIRDIFVHDGVQLVVIEQPVGGGCAFDNNDETGEQSGHAMTFMDSITQAMPTAQHETLDDYLKQQHAPRRLMGLFKLPVKYVLVDGDELSGLAQPRERYDYWAEFYKHYPHSPGSISFSLVGFNRTHTQAFVYVSHGCGWLCGDGEYVLLEKRAGAWQIVNQRVVWVS